MDHEPDQLPDETLEHLGHLTNPTPADARAVQVKHEVHTPEVVQNQIHPIEMKKDDSILTPIMNQLTNASSLPTPPTPSSPSTATFEQQMLARLNSLTQMTSQIAAIALEKSGAGKSETDSLEWVTNISRSLQTELQSVFQTLHHTPTPSSTTTTAESGSVEVAPSGCKTEVTLSSLLADPKLEHPASPSNSEEELDPSALLLNKKGRRRRKTKSKDSFNHMNRKCASCQRVETTKWRHGPLGSNTLCNTCGLAYSRKKKREAEQAAKQSPTPEKET